MYLIQTVFTRPQTEHINCGLVSVPKDLFVK